MASQSKKIPLAALLVLRLLLSPIEICGATGIKNVTMNEPYFQGHFPGNQIMPTMLLLEGMAQTAGALCMHHLKVKEPPLIYFMSIDKARLRRPVRPGNIIHYRVEKIRSRGHVWRYRGQAVVDGNLVAQAEFSAAIVETGVQANQATELDPAPTTSDFNVTGR